MKTITNTTITAAITRSRTTMRIGTTMAATGVAEVAGPGGAGELVVAVDGVCKCADRKEGWEGVVEQGRGLH